MTELEAVNILLSVIGEAPVDKLATTNTNEITDASLARRTLSEVSQDVQAEGWGWNTNYNVDLAKTAGNEFVVDANTLSAVFYPDAYPDMEYVQRGNRIYDRYKNKFDFGTTDFNKLTVNAIVIKLDWELLPHTAQQYIVIRASRIYSDRFVNSNAIYIYTAADEEYARAMLMRSEERHQESNLLWGTDLGVSQGGGYFPSAGLTRRRI
tara:strand:+ start:275 stop:901 length:627 start_codon:yes stop_codon:yes gene_type:complete